MAPPEPKYSTAARAEHSIAAEEQKMTFKISYLDSFPSVGSSPIFIG